MSKSYLRANVEIIFEGDHHVIERQCSDGVWVLRNKSTGRALERTTTELFDAYASSTIKFEGRQLRSISASGPISLPRRPATEKALGVAKMRMGYVRAHAGKPWSMKAIERTIEEVWGTLATRPEAKPHWSTVYRWVRAFKESEESSSALIDAVNQKGNRSPRYSQDIIDICKETIDDTYLTDERPGVEHTVGIARARTRLANKQQPAGCQLAMPSRRLVQRLINELPAYDVCVARYRREAARKKYRASLNCRLTESPLQRAEMDHTRMDLFVVDDIYGLPLGRPWLTVLVDDYTRCILGLCLSFEPPSRATVSKCLRHAFMPKTGLREKYPDMKNDWTAFGVVSELVLDGGAEFHSHDLETICFDLNIEQHFSPRKTPWFKGKVERLQGTLNRGVAINTPGKTFEGIMDRDDYDPKLHAVVTMSGLMHVVNRWVVDIYHQKPHSALGCSPAQMWTTSMRPSDIPIMNDPLRFDAILGGAAERMLTHKGIEYAGLLYNSPEMLDLRRNLGDRISVDIRIDRSDLGSVIVLHPETGIPYRVPCVRLDYAQGLTEWQHDVCKRYSRERMQQQGDVDSWLDALLEISDIVAKEMKLGRRKGVTRQRLARWSQGKQAVPESNPVNESARVQSLLPPVAADLQVQGSVDAALAQTSVAGSTIVRKRFAPVFVDRANGAIDE